MRAASMRQAPSASSMAPSGRTPRLRWRMMLPRTVSTCDRSAKKSVCLRIGCRLHTRLRCEPTIRSETATAAQAGLQDYDIIRCVNYIRSEAAAGRDPRQALRAAASGGGACPWADDRYLRPVLEDDALLCFDYDDDPQAMYVPDQPWRAKAAGCLL